MRRVLVRVPPNPPFPHPLMTPPGAFSAVHKRCGRQQTLKHGREAMILRKNPFLGLSSTVTDGMATKSAGDPPDLRQCSKL